VAAVADCFVLTFRSIAKASQLAWTKIISEGMGKLDREDGTTRFTGIDLHVVLDVPAGTDRDRALGLLLKTEKACLVSNSLRCEVTLRPDVTVETIDYSDALAPSG
jgi:uncharacterized OsmC-like protein